MTEPADLARRVSALETRVDTLDQHGTRGMEGVRVQLAGIERDMGKLESSVSGMGVKLDDSVTAMRGKLESHASEVRAELGKIPRPRSQWPVLVPMYGLVAAVLALVVSLIAGHP